MLSEKFNLVYQCKKCGELCKLGTLENHKCNNTELAKQATSKQRILCEDEGCNKVATVHLCDEHFNDQPIYC